MTPPLPALDLDLRVEHGGHRVSLTGTGKRFTARFPTVASLLHFARIFWPLRKRFPREYSLRVSLRGSD
jgi:hypothetical protein